MISRCARWRAKRCRDRCGERAFAQLVGDGRLTVTIEAEERAARYQGIVALAGRRAWRPASRTTSPPPSSCRRASRSRADAERAGRSAAAEDAAVERAGRGARGGARSRPGRICSATWRRLDAPLLQLGWARAGAAPPVRRARLPAVRRARRCALPAAAATGASRGCCARSGARRCASIMAEQGAVTVTCEFCGRPYRFDAIDVERLFSAGAGLEGAALAQLSRARALRCLAHSRVRSSARTA